MQRYFLSQDNSSHWYIIPVDKQSAWEAWTGLDEDDEKSWTAPEWAIALSGSPSLVTFTDPQF